VALPSFFIVNDEAEAVQAIGRLAELERAKVRASFEERFTAERMARDYVSCYEALQTTKLKMSAQSGGFARNAG
jgi:hypothetical protein